MTQTNRATVALFLLAVILLALVLGAILVEPTLQQASDGAFIDRGNGVLLYRDDALHVNCYILKHKAIDCVPWSQLSGPFG